MVSKLRRVGLTATGMVQGVGFRFFVQHAAQARRLTGYVKNQYDGSVQIEIQGPEEKVRAFLQVMGLGPRLGRIDHLKLSELEWIPEENDFNIKF